MTAPNPLVAQPEHENAEPWSSTEGAGVFDSLADAAAPLFGSERDAVGVGFDVVGGGVELIGAVMNPLGALASAGVGFLIEHVEFLHEPLDWLAGDPTVITAQAQTWHNVSAELSAVAGDYETALAGLKGWDGAALEAYRGAVASYTDALRGSSAHATGVSESISAAGVLVGTTRAMIRDWIAELVGDFIVKGVVALAASPETLGASIAAFLADAVASAGALASKISSKIARLLETLGMWSDELRKMAVRFDHLGAAAEKVRIPLTRPTGPFTDAFGGAEWPLKSAAEMGKQTADARGDQRGWRGAPQ